jgi:hypothetical protein
MRFLAAIFVLLSLLSVTQGKDDSVADLVSKHLNAIGIEQARAAVKTQLVEGKLTFQYLNGSGLITGGLQFVSEGDKFVSVMKLPSVEYHGEQFATDGKKALIKQVQPGHYSGLGQFVFEHDEILKEGLFGGTLSTAWALSHLDERRARLQDQGIKKMDGRDLRRVDYFPKKNSDLRIQLYFQPETSRHVMTIYEYSIIARGGGGPDASAGQEERYIRLQESFSDFETVNNLTYPGRWTIQFTSGGGSRTIGRTSAISQFELTDAKISHNIPVDPKNFEIK